MDLKYKATYAKKISVVGTTDGERKLSNAVQGPIS